MEYGYWVTNTTFTSPQPWVSAFNISKNGQYQTVGYNSTSSGTALGVAVSVNYGRTWAYTTLTNVAAEPVWLSSSMSTDTGQYQALVSNYGVMFVSTNYGVNWSIKTITNCSEPTCVAISSSGQYWVVGDGLATQYDSFPNSGYIFVSSNYGSTFTAHNIQQGYEFVTISDTGQYCAATPTTYSGGYLSTSSDYGVTWANRGSSHSGYLDLCMSGSGTYQFTGWSGATPTYFYSNNYGVTWTQFPTIAGNPYPANLFGLSDTGQFWAVETYGTLPENRYVTLSLDFGATWTQVVNNLTYGNGTPDGQSLYFWGVDRLTASFFNSGFATIGFYPMTDNAYGTPRIFYYVSNSNFLPLFYSFNN